MTLDGNAQTTGFDCGARQQILRNGLKTVIDQVTDDADYTVIARRDAPDAVVMSLDTFNSLMETVHLLKSPANAAHLARSIEQYRQGKVQQRDLVDAG